MNQKIINSTISSLSTISVRRFFRSERGYQGALYCRLNDELEKQGLLNEDQILEMEYQKSSKHGMSQRPDIIFHIPVEHSGARTNENNFAVWALKANASARDAKKDYDKLEEMFRCLDYPLGFFININSEYNHLNTYDGSHGDRLLAFSVWFQGDTIRFKKAYFEGNEIREQEMS